MSWFLKEKENIKEILPAAPGGVCLISDTWSSMPGDHHICVTFTLLIVVGTYKKRTLPLNTIPPTFDGLSIVDDVVKHFSK